jgi:hypothetical protein
MLTIQLLEDMPEVGLYRGDIVGNVRTDGFNFYVAGRPSNPYPGISSNYTTVPTYAAIRWPLVEP